MTRIPTEHPVRLLCDQRGVYGIVCDSEALAANGSQKEVALLLRPDRIETDPRRAALQMISGGLRRGPFRNTLEDHFRQAVHHAMLCRAGLSWPPQAQLAWWSNDPAQQKRNRQKYHGLRLASLAVVNRLIAEALTVGDPDALKQARRFRIGSRNGVYQYAAKSRRALQLVEAFPTLALAICESWHARRETIKELVEHGVSLRQIAEIRGIPWAFKKVKPAAAQFALQCSELDQSLVHTYLPDSLAHQKVWLQSVAYASRVSRGYAEWVARHTIEIGTWEQIVYLVMDIADWVRASMAADAFVTRHFDPSMSLQTVRNLSREWHEAVANDQDWAGAPCPPPWYPASKIYDVEIAPIESRAELYREGHAMHHCVGSYADRVYTGELYIFGIRRGRERLATIALNRTLEGPGVLQVRGPCNTAVSQRIMQAIRKWLRSLPSPPPPPPPTWMQPPAEIGVAQTRHATAIVDAHQRGADARARGMHRRALPVEYRNAARACEALAWIKGWDGESLPLQIDTDPALRVALPTDQDIPF
jgi:PcfJ-like protein